MTTSQPRRVVHALMQGHESGLLIYRGYREPGQYDVVIAGKPVTLPTDTVVDTIERLGVITDIGDVHPLELVETDGQEYVLLVRPAAPRRRSLRVQVPAARVVAFACGYAAAHTVANQLPTARDDSATVQIRQVLTDPGPEDQRRLRVLGLMQLRGVSIGQLATRAGVSRRTVSEILTFGRRMPGELFQRMCDALGRDLPEVVPDPPDIARLRTILSAHDAGWVRYDGPADVNEARWRKDGVPKFFSLTMGGVGFEVPAGEVEGWLAGVGAFHGVVREG